jgi:hypothetical protein
MYKQERTCVCLHDAVFPVDIGEELEFHKGREYQVDVYPLYYAVYQNGGWNDVIYITEEQFNNNFKLIE